MINSYSALLNNCNDILKFLSKSEELLNMALAE